jgi:hypothetical protein
MTYAQTGPLPEPVAQWLLENSEKNTFAYSLSSFYEKKGYLTPKQVAAVEKNLSAPSKPAVTEQGVYALIDPEDLGLEVLRVKESKAGNLYAMVLDVETGKFEYERGAIRRIGPEDRLTMEQAVMLSQTYGRCMNCGRTLTNPESVELGIGPICRNNFIF